MKRDLAVKLRTVLQKYPFVRLCLVFGSEASGRSTARSDLDVAVAAEASLQPEARLELMEALSTATGCVVDLVDLTAESGPILKQALSKGKIVQNTDKSLYARIIARMLFAEADMMPYYRRILQERRERFLHG